MKQRPKHNPLYILITVTPYGGRKRWEVVWRPKGHPDLDGALGRIERPDIKNKKLYLQEGQPVADLFDTVIHEMAHGAGWNLAEEWVEAFAHDVSLAVKAIGFRIEADTDGANND